MCSPSLVLLQPLWIFHTHTHTWPYSTGFSLHIWLEHYICRGCSWNFSSHEYNESSQRNITDNKQHHQTGATVPSPPDGWLDLTDIFFFHPSEIVQLITAISVCSSARTTELFGPRCLRFDFVVKIVRALQTTSQSRWPTFLWYWTVELLKMSRNRIFSLMS